MRKVCSDDSIRRQLTDLFFKILKRNFFIETEVLARSPEEEGRAMISTGHKSQVSLLQVRADCLWYRFARNRISVKSGGRRTEKTPNEKVVEDFVQR